MHAAPSWPDHAIFWHVYPLGFTGAPVRPVDDADRAVAAPVHRLPQLTAWLDHAVELGTNALLLGPVFRSSTHGYDTLDHLQVDPRLGDEADLVALIEACHDQGLRVVLDGVFNHVGVEHPRYVAALEAGAEGPDAGLFALDWSTTPPRPRVFEGHGSLVALDHASPLAADLVADVMLHWMRLGVDGWRLDAAYAVPPEFWRGVVGRVRAEFPDAWFVGEMIHGDYADYVERSGLDSVTQYELWKSIWSSLQDTNFHELDWTLRRHAGFLEHFVPQTFVGNHDVTRIATQVGRDRVPLALTVLMTVGGVPSVYYGDEHAYEATKEEREGGDDAIRPAFPPSPADLAPWGDDIFRLHQDLIGLRRRHPWLVTARTEAVELTNERYVYRSVGDGGESLTVTLDLSGTPSARVDGPDGATLLQV